MVMNKDLATLIAAKKVVNVTIRGIGAHGYSTYIHNDIQVSYVQDGLIILSGKGFKMTIPNSEATITEMATDRSVWVKVNGIADEIMVCY